MTTWKTERSSVQSDWAGNREDKQTKSRLYLLGSFFELIKTAIIDDKDDKALSIKTDPAYYAKPGYKGRTAVETSWKSRIYS